MVSKADKQKAEKLVAEAAQKLASKDYEGVISLLDESIQLNSDDDTAWNNRGAAKNNLGRYEEAIKDLDEATQLNPDNDSAWNNRGIAKSHIGQHEEALKDFDKAIDIYHGDARTWNSRGTAKAHLGRFDEAIKDVEEALRLQPDHPPYVNNLAAIRAEKRAQKLFEERFGSANASTEDLKAEAKRHREEYVQYKADLKKALNNLFKLIAGIFGVLASVFLVLIASNATAIQLDAYLPFAFAPWFVMVAFIISPRVTAIRLLMQQANKAEMMAAEYAHLAYIEDRILLYFAGNDDAKSIDVKADYLKAMLGKTPSDKLLAIINRGKGKSDGNQSPTERIINEFRKNSGDKTSS